VKEPYPPPRRKGRGADVAVSLAPKITTQYRSKQTMIYELEARGIAFDIRISRDDEDHDPRTWHVEAHNGFSEAALAVGADGATARAALSAVAQSWRSTGPDLGLPELDWEEVAKVLGAVRAI
jgi:hypothetical protein